MKICDASSYDKLIAAMEAVEGALQLALYPQDDFLFIYERDSANDGLKRAASIIRTELNDLYAARERARKATSSFR